MLRYLTDPLRGRTPLWQVIWIYGFGGSLAYLLIEPLFPDSHAGKGVYYALGVAVSIVQAVMLWRCSYNAKSPVYGRFLRVLVVISVALLPLLLYVLWTHPEVTRLLEESGPL
jgi:hypothetical protein